MNATFTREQLLLQDTATMVARQLGASTANEVAPADAVAGRKLLADAGLLGLRAPLEAGGGGASGVEVAIVAEALAKRACPVPFVGPVLAADLLARGAADDGLSALVDGTVGTTIVLAEDLTRLAMIGADRTA